MPPRIAAPLVGALALGCHALTDPALPRAAERFDPPPVYARWWAMTEACSGVTRPLGAVAFYRVPGARTVPTPDGDVAGYWSPQSNRVVLADFVVEDGGLVRHEMLHALLRRGGHPRAAFLGRCAGVVPCEGSCVRDAGPAPASDPSAVRVGPGALEVSAAVAPAAPGTAVEGGHFTFTVRVRNPAPHAVVVVPPAPPVEGLSTFPVRYRFRIAGAAGALEPDAAGGMPDPAGYAYGPGETRQRVYDLSVAPGAVGWATELPGRGFTPVLGPGRYVLTGGYGNPFGARADSVVVTLGP